MAMTNPYPATPPTLKDLLEEARHRIQVTDRELEEARRRRDLLSGALLAEFPGSRAYVNGSVAHGDALNPLTDVDLGVVVVEAKFTHGPGLKGCADLQQRAADAIRRALKGEFPDLRVEWKGRKRSILVRFKKPVSPGTEDFTADVIVAIDNPAGDGLFIPNRAGWSRSHPEAHTALVRSANETSHYTYARIIRLLKHWNRSNGKPLCSWNIKALALDPLCKHHTLLNGLVDWFDHAISELSKGLTPDPAGVAPQPIKVHDDLTLTQVVDKLKAGQSKLLKAIEHQNNGEPFQAHELLAKFFNDPEMLPYPNEFEVRAEINRRFSMPAAAGGGLAIAANVGAGAARPAQNVRSWGADHG